MQQGVDVKKNVVGAGSLNQNLYRIESVALLLVCRVGQLSKNRVVSRSLSKEEEEEEESLAKI